MFKCISNNKHGISCTRPLNHDGPHQNNSGDEPPVEWPNLRSGICREPSPQSDAVCHRDKGHDGPHVDGNISWGF